MDPAETKDTGIKRRIATAAFSLFARRSFSEVTVKGICREAHCARSTFYEHFSGKLDVLRFILTEQYAWPDGMDEQLDRSPVEALFASPCRFLHYQLLLGPRTMKAYFHALIDGTDGFLLENHQEHNVRLAASIRQAIQEGLVCSPCPPGELACLSIFTLSHLSMTWASLDGAFDLAGEAFLHLCGLYGLNPNTWRTLWETCVEQVKQETLTLGC